MSGDLTAPYEIFNLYRKKYKQRYDNIAKELEAGFDYTTLKVYDVEGEEKTWKQTEGELDEQWDKIMLSQAINMKLSGSTDSSIVSTLKKR